MSWLELTEVTLHFFYPGDPIGEPNPANPTDIMFDEVGSSLISEITTLDPVFYFDVDNYHRIFPDESSDDETTILKAPVTGFNFNFITQEVDNPFSSGLLRGNCESMGFEYVIESDDCEGLMRIAQYLVANNIALDKKPDAVTPIRYAQFLAVWYCDSWSSYTDCGEEWDSETSLYGFIDLHSINTKTGLQITTLDQIPEGEINENTKSNL